MGVISETTNYIINRFQLDTLVNTIAFNDTSIIDTKKENIYPLVSIQLLSKTTSDDLHLLNYRISVLQQRNQDRKVNPSKLMADVNFIDNLNECDDIATRFINYVRRMDVDTNTNIDSLSEIEIVSGYGGGNLDGIRFDLVLSIPNTGYCGG